MCPCRLDFGYLMEPRDKDPNPCRVIGVLDDGIASLNATALAHVRSADVVIGGSRTLALLAHEFKPGAVLLKEIVSWVAV